ncbi:MAG: hypothetical protein ACOYXC_04680 [Candidatus Rifleibacteriota bacterium]
MINKRLFIVFLAVICFVSPVRAGLFTPLVDIVTRPESFEGKFVTVKGEYYGWSKAPGYPPITRSDWVIADEFDNSVYCTGKLPQTFAPASESSLGQPITVLAIVRCKDFQPYLEVQEIKTINFQVEEMVSVAQILFDPIDSQNRNVSLMGVLAKGYGVKGERVYLIADPTGALKLGRLPKLYPRGTILHVRGIVASDENGLPMLDKVEIISARVD